MMTVGQQWDKTRIQLLSGLPKGNRDGIIKGNDDVWKELQSQNKVPGNEEKKRLTLFLSKAEIQAKEELDQHQKTEKGSMIIRRKWKKEAEEKELQTILFRKAVMSGMPKTVKEAM